MPAPITNIEDLRVLARRRIPKALFEYVDGGSYDELTLRANRADLDAVRLRQRVMVDTSTRDLSTTMLGEKVAMPVAIAPTGLTGLIHGDGEILAARAAEAAGLKFCLSTLSICTIEDVASAVKRPIWYQLYVFKDRGFARAMIERASAVGCTTMFLTVDLPYRGQRRADIKNGLSVPPRVTLRNCWDIATKPKWAMSVLMGKRKSFGNLDSYLGSQPGYAPSVLKTGSWATSNSDQSLNWRDLDWIRERWTGKLVLKGILDVEDAKNAAREGVDGIVVSNHGGRQLDGAAGSISVLPHIADAVGDRIEVLFDSGVRSGHDVFKALANGARGCLIGRAYLYGLAAMGEAGVAAALEVIRESFDNAMILTGTTAVNQITRDKLHRTPLTN
ncbi:MAG TPA: alpha-hydroxy acid oxidase [Xanthobacteraceae bacterium]|nr:alpha-hydroxy acid oxidase [Xanthobacteraceae bacterium]